MDQHRFDAGPDPDLDRRQNKNSDPDRYQNDADHYTGFNYLPGSQILSGHDEACDPCDVKKGKERFSLKKLADLAFLFLRRCFSPSLSVELC